MKTNINSLQAQEVNSFIHLKMFERKKSSFIAFSFKLFKAQQLVLFNYFFHNGFLAFFFFLETRHVIYNVRLYEHQMHLASKVDVL